MTWSARRAGRWLPAAILAALALGSLGRMGLLNPLRYGPALARLALFARDLVPPRAEALPTLLPALLETIEIAFAGTLIGFLASVPLAFAAARTLVPAWLSAAARMVIAAVRTLPSVLFGVLFVVAFGLGPAAGTLAVACYTTGYLAKLYAEAFEAVDPEVLEAVRGAGGNRLQLLRYCVVPESANSLVSQLLFMFEYNIRASTIMGFVGAGGIGYYMLGYLQLLQYRNLFTALLLTFVVVMAVDALSVRLRAAVMRHP
jgi:phosphonate transport system permease protein